MLQRMKKAKKWKVKYTDKWEVEEKKIISLFEAPKVNYKLNIKMFK
jgi:hypothetical protein